MTKRPRAIPFLIGLSLLALAAIGLDATRLRSARPSLAIESTRALGLTDLALSSTARWLRHPSQAERSAAVADTPYPLDVEPAGGILLPPREGPR